MTNAEARFNNSLRPRKPESSLGRTAQDVHLDSHTAPELCGLQDVTKALFARCGQSTFCKEKRRRKKIGAGILLFVFLGDHDVSTGLSVDFEKLMLFMF